MTQLLPVMYTQLTQELHFRHTLIAIRQHMPFPVVPISHMYCKAAGFTRGKPDKLQTSDAVCSIWIRNC